MSSFADINIQPDPVKFVQLTTKYWEPFGEMRPGYLNLMYAPPEGCKLANVTADPDFAAEVCAPDSLDVNATTGKCRQISSSIFQAELPRIEGLEGNCTRIQVLILLQSFPTCCASTAPTTPRPTPTRTGC